LETKGHPATGGFCYFLLFDEPMVGSHK